MLKVVVEMRVLSGGESREEFRDVSARRRERLDEVVGVDKSEEYMAKSSEAYVCAVQALRTRMLRAKIDDEDVIPKCSVCGKWDETVMHLANGCGEFGKKQYVVRHDRMGVRVHWESCKKYGVKIGGMIMIPVSANKEGYVDIYWDMTVVTAKGEYFGSGLEGVKVDPCRFFGSHGHQCGQERPRKG